MFVASFDAPVIPEWAMAGLLIDGEQLRECLPMLAKQGPQIEIETGTDHKSASIRSIGGRVRGLWRCESRNNNLIGTQRSWTTFPSASSPVWPV